MNNRTEQFHFFATPEEAKLIRDREKETGSIYKEDIDDIRLHQEELWKVMKEILKRLSTI